MEPCFLFLKAEKSLLNVIERGGHVGGNLWHYNTKVKGMIKSSSFGARKTVFKFLLHQFSSATMRKLVNPSNL